MSLRVDHYHHHHPFHIARNCWSVALPACRLICVHGSAAHAACCVRQVNQNRLCVCNACVIILLLLDVCARARARTGMLLLLKCGRGRNDDTGSSVWWRSLALSKTCTRVCLSPMTNGLYTRLSVPIHICPCTRRRRRRRRRRASAHSTHIPIVCVRAPAAKKKSLCSFSPN